MKRIFFYLAIIAIIGILDWIYIVLFFDSSYPFLKHINSSLLLFILTPEVIVLVLLFIYVERSGRYKSIKKGKATL